MAAPRGTYTPSRGPLAGQTFAMRPGDAPTAPYNRYQAARASASGFRSYSAEKQAIRDPLFRSLESLARHVGGASPRAARSQVREFMADQGRSPSGGRKANAISWGIDMGYLDPEQDEYPEVEY